MEKEIIKGYKGFDKDLKCRDKQYAIGETFMEEKTKLCDYGMHFCENPHDIFGYYEAGNNNRFCEVEASDVSDEREGDSKRVAKTLFVKAEISVFQICKIAVSTFFENFGFNKKIESADCNVAGYRGAANAGDNGAANAGDRGAANAGYCGAANAGDNGAANAGDNGAANAGDRGAANAGNRGAANAGDNGVAVVSNEGKVKGGLGCILVARNIEYNDNTNKHEVTDWACAIVDGEKIKADTWYHLIDGELKEVKKEENGDTRED